MQPAAGHVRHGTNLEIAYFDQLHAQLDDEKSVRENVRDGSDSVTINGRTRHIIGYLEDFLFTPKQAGGPVTRLSGGERNRLLLARLFAKPSNVLVMDEPTNDLDLETLELLEDLLSEYPGTLLLVSHDREFLNNVVTSTLVLEGEGRVKEYAGGYDDWLRQRPAAEPAVERTPAAKPRPRGRPAAATLDLQGAARVGGPAGADRDPGDRTGPTASNDGRPGVLSPGPGGNHPHQESSGVPSERNCRNVPPLGRTGEPRIMQAASRNKFYVEIIKPSHYDDEGYVIQWRWAFVPSNSLACLYALAADVRAAPCAGRRPGLGRQHLRRIATRSFPSRKIARRIRPRAAGA